MAPQAKILVGFHWFCIGFSIENMIYECKNAKIVACFPLQNPLFRTNLQKNSEKSSLRRFYLLNVIISNDHLYSLSFTKSRVTT